MPLSFVRKLYAHMEWADAFVWRSVMRHHAAGRDDFVVESLVHLHLVQRAWLSAWTGEEVLLPTREDFAGLDEIRDWGLAYHEQVAGFLDGLDEGRLGEVIPIPWTELIEEQIGGPASPAKLADMLVQVAAHSVHHRAQINRRIRELGGEPGLVDYIGWVWRGEPAADWSS